MRVLSAFTLVALAACGQNAVEDTIPTTAPAETAATSPPTTAAPTTTTTTALPTTTTTKPTTTTTISPFARPDWLGTLVLPLRDDGFGEVQPTPDELRGRAFETLDLLPPPTDAKFTATSGPIPADVLPRTTWHDECPVGLDDLSYITLSHWGFDGALHTGELIVNASVADDVIWVFQQLFDAQFPIEQMRVIAPEDLEAPPTGDGNETTSFVCRPVVTSTTTWSQHAYGLAVDINPFHNPYEKGDLVLPELSSYYLDRSLEEPGMIIEGDVVVAAFDAIGWGWGGRWRSLDDYMHFSQNGR